MIEVLADIKRINSFISDRSFGMIDEMLTESIEDLSAERIVTRARATFPIRSRLIEWTDYVIRADVELTERGMNSKRLLKGLL